MLFNIKFDIIHNTDFDILIDTVTYCVTLCDMQNIM